MNKSLIVTYFIILTLIFNFTNSNYIIISEADYNENNNYSMQEFNIFNLSTQFIFDFPVEQQEGAFLEVFSEDIDNDGNIEVISGGWSTTLGADYIYSLDIYKNELEWISETQARSPLILNTNTSVKNVVGMYKSLEFGFGIKVFNGITGNEIWNRSLSDSVNSGFIIVNDLNQDFFDDIVVVTNIPGNAIYGLNGQNGDVLWSTVFTSNIRPTRMEAGYFSNDSIPDIVLATLDGYIVQIDGSDGTIIKTVDVEDFAPLAIEVKDVTMDGIDDYFIGYVSTNLVLYDGLNNAELWSFTNNSQVVRIRLFENENDISIFVGTLNGFIFKLNTTDGSKLWSYFIGEDIKVLEVFDVTNDLISDIIFGTGEGKVFVVNGDNLNIIWQLDLNFDWLWNIAVFKENNQANLIVPYNNQILVYSTSEATLTIPITFDTEIPDTSASSNDPNIDIFFALVITTVFLVLILGGLRTFRGKKK